jgi:sec-independent protein translocase protein TatA
VLSGIGPLEIGIVLVIALLVFGPKKLPELGSSLGRGIRGFGHGLKGEEDAPALDAKTEETTLPRS